MWPDQHHFPDKNRLLSPSPTFETLVVIAFLPLGRSILAASSQETTMPLNICHSIFQLDDFLESN
jgi:hypothetical protein